MAVPSTTTIPVAAAGNFGSSKRSRWEEKFQQLFQYKIEHGHCNPSAKSTDIATRKIGIWVGTQRYVPLTAAEDEFQRQNGTGGQLKPLSEEEVRKLNAIGFDWRCPSSQAGSSNLSPWEERFQQLFQYKIEHGHCNPSSESTDIATRKIGTWVLNQRRRQNGTNRSLRPLSEEEVRKLNAIGFDWRCPSRPPWDVRYQQLKCSSDSPTPTASLWSLPSTKRI
eukprot:scaffold5916_cov92-Cylindrotheca_fusiformis.AAC.1